MCSSLPALLPHPPPPAFSSALSPAMRTCVYVMLSDSPRGHVALATQQPGDWARHRAVRLLRTGGRGHACAVA